MARIAEHEFPEDRFYDVRNQVWYAPLADGTTRAGFTPLSMALAGDALVFTPKRIGKPVERDRWFAMVECGKWIGSARSAFDGVIVAANERLVAQPSLLNTDAFGEGWMALLRADDPAWSEALVTGPTIAEVFAEWLAREAYREHGD